MARALNLVGERWALLVVRELLLGPKRFADLRTGLPAISPNVLSQRLEELVERGLVTRLEVGPPVSYGAYALTPFGATLEPLLLALADWGSRSALPGAKGELSTDALVLALRTTFRPDRAVVGTYRLHLGRDCIDLRARVGSLTARRVRDPDVPAGIVATVTTSSAVLRSVTFGGQAPASAEAGGRLRIHGDREAALRLLSRFDRPSLHEGATATLGATTTERG